MMSQRGTDCPGILPEPSLFHYEKLKNKHEFVFHGILTRIGLKHDPLNLKTLSKKGIDAIGNSIGKRPASGKTAKVDGARNTNSLGYSGRAGFRYEGDKRNPRPVVQDDRIDGDLGQILF